MLGHDHALSGALAFAAVAPWLPVSGIQLAVAATLTAGAGILPDLDSAPCISAAITATCSASRWPPWSSGRAGTWSR
jgi:hypothetical protein